MHAPMIKRSRPDADPESDASSESTEPFAEPVRDQGGLGGEGDKGGGGCKPTPPCPPKRAPPLQSMIGRIALILDMALIF